MKKKITVVFEFNHTDWNGYDDVTPELILDDAIECKRGVSYTIIKEETE